jgi:hypothetical protein
VKFISPYLNSEPAETDSYKKEKASASADWKTIVVSTLFIMPWFLSTTLIFFIKCIIDISTLAEFCD